MSTTEGKRASVSMLPVLYLAAFVAAFNSSVVNVAVPSIMADMGVDASATSWLVSGYMMVQAVMMSIYAFLSKRFDTRTLYLAAAVVFCVGELGAAIAPTFVVLLVFRVTQALGGAVFIPVMMGAVLALSPRERVGTNLALGNAIIGAAPAFSPMVCGVLVGSFGWRSVFLFPLVLMGIMAAAGIAFVRPIAPTEDARVDVASVVMVSVTITAFIYGMSRLSANLVVALVALVVSAVVGYLFVRRQNALEQPLLSMAPLRSSTFAMCCLMVILCVMQNFSMSLMLPTYYQSVVGVSAAQSGMLLFTPAIVMMLAMIVSGRLHDRFGSWPLIPLGIAGIVAGQLLVRTFGASQSLVPVVLSSVIVFLCVGLVMSPIQTTGLKTLPPNLNPAGVSFINICLQGGSAVGPALFTGILSSVAANATASGVDVAGANAAGFVAAVTCAAILATVALALSFIVTRKTGE